MKLGLATPVVIQQPGVASQWEATAGPDELALIAEAADGLGFDHLTCSEHIGVPALAATVRGATYWDPLATLSFLAARTRHIRLATSVLVLGYHHPLHLAKSYGTLDRLSRGRVILGVGVGSLKEEFDLLGAEWTDRGAGADRAIVELRAAWGQRVVDGLIIEPHALTTDLPVWVGGRTKRSLRRAVHLGTGWVPFGLPAAAISEFLAQYRLPDEFEVVLSPGAVLDPIGEATAARRELERLRDVGATIVTCRLQATNADHYCDQLAALQSIAKPL
ncbi:MULTISPECIES: TIGR03619 family F420-dependent LLM class oxidoreductase [unclassified Mycolicibacterium]|uniref:TIGR03619 family F420-dependent LLM class oxidoreductase n=1 Tax=unclassified Mycolicibacterium TaxID=2636767 RepID=UPI0013065A7B|nr:MULTISPECIES: TIGR03619 family F420-dependent LLM class oxidoreductase [unclassified Mycolicibacterium]MUL80781.1 TIGR03619 family F420-dependent LLM class oxidoreductase [Mycolicibacterium sp. CBMA 329]MUL86548.1 TIGR03619 family F420-dependent LLM class oxidoreductase [Mycolicibacterium sp. CBMA 331]MUM01409.1 TIGR03619 family F420-dependent LLM class oxidoreductase [Mycolicibacterium sp. CBMA 334]MUM25918.1 TIGR03619 family F420-dependent LLM class oxidoreductase [Mycolicibacterium sp. CB